MSLHKPLLTGAMVLFMPLLAIADNPTKTKVTKPLTCAQLAGGADARWSSGTDGLGRPPSDAAKPPFCSVTPAQEAALHARFQAMHAPSDAVRAATRDAANKLLASAPKELTGKSGPAHGAEGELATAPDRPAWQAALRKHDGALRRAIALGASLDTAQNRSLLAAASGSPITTIRAGVGLVPTSDAVSFGPKLEHGFHLASHRPLGAGGDTQKRGPRGESAPAVRPGGGGATGAGATGAGQATQTNATPAPVPVSPDTDGTVRINELWLLGREGGSLHEASAMAPRGNRLDVAAAMFALGSRHHWHARGEQFSLSRAGMHRVEVLFGRDPLFPGDRGTGFQNRIYTIGGYVNAEVRVSMQVLDGTSTVCSESRTVDRRWLLLAGVDWAESDNANWLLKCDFKHAADRPAGPYFLAVRVDAWAGGGGALPENVVSAQIRADVHASIKPH